MYEDQTKEAILQRMLDASPEDIDKRQGSVTNDLLSPPAIEMTGLYTELDTVLTLGFTDTTSDDYLDRRAADYGLARKPAVKATGTLTFSGPDGTVIPAGTITSTGATVPVYFVTTADVTIASTNATVATTAEEAGASGNVSIGAVNTMVGDLVGIVTVTNPVNFEGGVDGETDGAFRDRYYERARRPVTSGNANHYRQWAREVPGVADARVYPVWSGAGTVKVVLLGDDKTAPDAPIITAAQTYIDPTQDGRGEGQAPLGAVATVVGAEEVPINIVADVDLAPGATLDEVKALVTAGSRAYLETLAFADPIVRINQIGNVVIDLPPVRDYASLTLNGTTGNIIVADGQVAVLGTVTIT
ncbi:putative phage protein gp47/JayE [Paenibacillus sp. RC254]|uniref:baseplate J/gp47 family protein n=1 Tax=unclassified Paenibacillus TaxID=185978 RepID=UPI0024BBACDC|nr:MULTISPECIES: baseplate J/gp47 family protein [unclassified Paenibacillus]